ncbi:MAG: trigger factor [Legionellales bacterium]|nr:trigger factor [Legionellales bacterium]
MEFNIEKLSTLERKISVQISEDNLNSEIKTKLKMLATKVKLPGFRPGKIPLQVIENKYGKEARQEVISKLMQNSLQKALIESKVEPITNPTIDELNDSRGLKFSAKFEVKPEIIFADISQVKFIKYEAEITDEDVESAIMELRKQHTVWQESEEPVKDGMKVKVDFVGKIDGKEFSGGSGEDFDFVVGAGSMLEEFEKGIIGLQKNESKSVPVTFPDDYFAKELAGKQASFDITLKQISSPVLPDVNDDFMKKFGEKSGSLDSFKDKIRNNLKNHLQKRKDLLFQEDVFKKFSDANNIELPKGLVKHEATRLSNSYIENMKQHGKDVKNDELLAAKFEDRAKENIKLGLLVNEYVIQNKVNVDEQKVSEKITFIASTYADPEAVSKWLYSDKEQLDKIKSEVLEKQVVDTIADHSQVEIKNLSYTEIMKK